MQKMGGRVMAVILTLAGRRLEPLLLSTHLDPHFTGLAKDDDIYLVCPI